MKTKTKIYTAAYL